MLKKKIINYKDQEVWCYGQLNGKFTEDCVISMVYSYGEDFVDNYNYITEAPFKTWTDCVKYLIDLDRFGTIHQLEATK
tara:strand:+ start:375 stop:611 length:237 start_codon:yes stop_codon:yes gene_type:complete